MVLWICLAIVVVALGVLLVLLIELRAKQRRLSAALGLAQQQADQAKGVVGALHGIQPPTLRANRPPAEQSRSAGST